MSSRASASLSPDHMLYAPGLKLRKRKDGVVRVWLAPQRDRWFEPRYVAFPANMAEWDVAAECRANWAELIEWRNAMGRAAGKPVQLPDIENYTGPGGVYFIECQGGDRQIKIGYSTDPAARKRALETSCPYPVKMLAFQPGPPELERFFHRRFVKERVNREWFLPSPELRYFIKNLGPILDRMVKRGRTGVLVPRSQVERPGTSGWNLC